MVIHFYGLHQLLSAQLTQLTKRNYSVYKLNDVNNINKNDGHI